MIASLRGQLTRKGDGRVVVEAAGVGYLVHVPAFTELSLPQTGAETFLHVHTHVREDAIQLFGFSTDLELLLFDRLLGVSGIGPKLAVAALSGLSATDLAHAIAGGEVAQLARINGIGKKTAERIVLELSDKMKEIAPPRLAPARDAAAPRDRADALSALLNLGYRQREAEAAIDRAASDGVSRLEDLVKAALARLARRTP